MLIIAVAALQSTADCDSTDQSFSLSVRTVACYGSVPQMFVRAGCRLCRFSRTQRSCPAGRGRSWRGWRKTTEKGGRGHKKKKKKKKKENGDHHYKPHVFPLDQNSTEHAYDAITERECITGTKWIYSNTIFNTNYLKNECFLESGKEGQQTQASSQLRL